MHAGSLFKSQPTSISLREILFESLNEELDTYKDKLKTILKARNPFYYIISLIPHQNRVSSKLEGKTNRI